MRILRLGCMIGLVAWASAGAPANAQPTDKEMIACQRALDSRLDGVAKSIGRFVGECAFRITECELREEHGAPVAGCTAKVASRCVRAETQVARTVERGEKAILKKCGGLPLATLQPYVTGLGFRDAAADCAPAPVTTVAELVGCLVARAKCAAERDVFRGDPRAQTALGTAGVATAFPCVGP